VKTQQQLYWQAHNRLANINKTFMQMVTSNDITSSELAYLIQKRPETYGHLEGWVETLRERETAEI